MVKIKYKGIISFLILTLVLSGVVAAANSVKSFPTTEPAPVPYTSSVTSTYLLPPSGAGFIVGYYINPSVTPLSKINFTELEKSGITDIYVRVSNDNYASILPDAKKRADVVGIKTHAWVFPGFRYASEVAGMNIGVHLDVETYDMPSYIPEIKAMQEATQGVTFSLCVKPEIWDGNQYYNRIVPLCDYIVPMLYIGDYPHGLSGLKYWAWIYNILYPRKIVAGLQTYQSYQNTTPVSQNTLYSQIRAVQPNTRGVILFRYGLSNFSD